MELQIGVQLLGLRGRGGSGKQQKEIEDAIMLWTEGASMQRSFDVLAERSAWTTLYFVGFRLIQEAAGNELLIVAAVQ